MINYTKNTSIEITDNHSIHNRRHPSSDSSFYFSGFLSVPGQSIPVIPDDLSYDGLTVRLCFCRRRKGSLN